MLKKDDLNLDPTWCKSNFRKVEMIRVQAKSLSPKKDFERGKKFMFKSTMKLSKERKSSNATGSETELSIQIINQD